MDRNSIIGLLLIGAILIGFSIYNQPSEQELALAKAKQDSIAMVEKKIAEDKMAVAKSAQTQSNVAPVALSDSAKQVQNTVLYGAFASATTGDKKYITLENELIKAEVSTKGGTIKRVTLKTYKTYGGKPLELFSEDSSKFSMNFFAQNKSINTDSLYFTASSASLNASGKDSVVLSMRAAAGEGKYLEYVYVLKPNSYQIDSKVNLVGLNDLIPANMNQVYLNWQINMPTHEKSLKNERAASTIYYKFKDEDPDYLSEAKDEKEVFQSTVKWVGFKQQFFTSTIIAKDYFDKPVEVETKTSEGSTKYVKNCTALLSFPYKHTANESFAYSFYYGPTQFKTLESYGHSLEKQVPLGWGILGWINKYLVINLFNFLDQFNWNYGIVILILTLVIKTILLPLTYKAYLSTAKMRVLKPEMDEINQKHEKDPMKKQQAIMSLYKKAGVNPLGGCIPMLLQLPILFALFRFFPASIELRQKAFLWAEDLSSYDSVLNLSFNIPFYGDHVSLFALLMTFSTVLYTRMNNQLTGGSDQQMQMMKWMMYLMPIVFLGVMNSYSAGLSYYYFLANMITFGQQFYMRKMVDETALHKQIEENKKKPVVKSKFQQRLEDMAKQQQQKAKQLKK